MENHQLGGAQLSSKPITHLEGSGGLEKLLNDSYVDWVASLFGGSRGGNDLKV